MGRPRSRGVISPSSTGGKPGSSSGASPTHPRSAMCNALESILAQVLEVGVARYAARHADIAHARRAGVKALGLQPWRARGNRRERRHGSVHSGGNHGQAIARPHARALRRDDLRRGRRAGRQALPPWSHGQGGPSDLRPSNWLCWSAHWLIWGGLPTSAWVLVRPWVDGAKSYQDPPSRLCSSVPTAMPCHTRSVS